MQQAFHFTTRNVDTSLWCHQNLNSIALQDASTWNESSEKFSSLAAGRASIKLKPQLERSNPPFLDIPVSHVVQVKFYVYYLHISYRVKFIFIFLLFLMLARFAVLPEHVCTWKRSVQMLFCGVSYC